MQNLYFWLDYLKYGLDEFHRASIKLQDPPQLEPFSDMSFNAEKLTPIKDIIIEQIIELIEIRFITHYHNKLT